MDEKDKPALLVVGDDAASRIAHLRGSGELADVQVIEAHTEVRDLLLQMDAEEERRRRHAASPRMLMSLLSAAMAMGGPMGIPSFGRGSVRTHRFKVQKDRKNFECKGCGMTVPNDKDGRDRIAFGQLDRWSGRRTPLEKQICNGREE